MAIALIYIIPQGDLWQINRLSAIKRQSQKYDNFTRTVQSYLAIPSVFPWRGLLQMSE